MTVLGWSACSSALGVSATETARSGGVTGHPRGGPKWMLASDAWGRQCEPRTTQEQPAAQHDGAGVAGACASAGPDGRFLRP